MERLTAAFDAVFPGAPVSAGAVVSAGVAASVGRRDLEIVRAPGCVNLIGDHTAYNEGFVLPAAIELEMWIAFRRRRDGKIRMAALGSDERGSFWIDDLAPGSMRAGAESGGAGGAERDTVTGRGDATGDSRDTVTGSAEATGGARATVAAGRWLDYVAGTAWSLREAALPICGFDGVVDSDIPPGIGLSPTAALELATALALLRGTPMPADPALAALAQRAERDYVGVDGGIVDQFAGAAGREGRALLLDCRSLESRLVAMPWGIRVVVCDTGSPGRPPTHALRDRRAECGRVVALLAERLPWLGSLRDLDAALLRRQRALLPEVLARRAEHVVAENARVVAAVAAMESNDLDELGRLFAESHASLRGLYEVGSPALDEMVGVALAVPGVVAARMTGDEFGECTVNLVLADAVPALVAAVQGEYRRRTGLAGTAYPVAVVDGAGPVVGRSA